MKSESIESDKRIFRQEVRFLGLFILFFVIFQCIYFSGREYLTPIVVDKLNVNVSTTLINLITPAQNASGVGRTIQADAFQLIIAPGCEGIEGIFLLVAALLAFPLNTKRKITGILLGSFLMYVLNLVRIISLYYIGRYQPSLSIVMHTYVWQVIIIFAGILFFLMWVNKAVTKHEKTV